VKRNAVKRYINQLFPFIPSGMLIHRQNSYAARGTRRSGRHKAQSREKKQKTLYLYIAFFPCSPPDDLLNKFKYLYL
jgi:hypothetical protein